MAGKAGVTLPIVLFAIAAAATAEALAKLGHRYHLFPFTPLVNPAKSHNRQ
ncbi:MAG TPA: hypothetical protein VH280_15500 [Verrucomicrobiae bacterium]|jgi:hypothetical protein|nr:hypothetical protein [Verrucomicrobiae bacterium]